MPERIGCAEVLPLLEAYVRNDTRKVSTKMGKKIVGHLASCKDGCARRHQDLVASRGILGTLTDPADRPSRPSNEPVLQGGLDGAKPRPGKTTTPLAAKTPAPPVAKASTSGAKAKAPTPGPLTGRGKNRWPPGKR